MTNNAEKTIETIETNAETPEGGGTMSETTPPTETTQPRKRRDVTEAEVTDFLRFAAQKGGLDDLKELLLDAEDARREGEAEAARLDALDATGDGPAAWRAATSFPEVCDLMARWIEGTVKYQPGYGASGVDPETGPLVPVLAALNRAGLLTTCSQPGELDAHGRQRAFVSGFAPEALAKRIAKLGLFTDLIAVVNRPGEGGYYVAPGAVDGYRPCLWLGTEDAEELAEEVGAKAAKALKKAWSVCVFDPQWGRADYLWDHLARELCYDVTPLDEELGTDFIA